MTKLERIDPGDFLVAAEVVPNPENFTDWLIEDPSARYRLRAALNTFDIRPRESQGLGYTREPFIDMNRFCDYFELPIDPESDDARKIAYPFLHGSIQLRKDHKAFTEGKDREVKLDVFQQLPTFLQMLAAFKVIEGVGPVRALTEEVQRGNLKSYFTDRLGVGDERAEDMLKSAAIVHANDVLLYFLSPSRESDNNNTGVSIANLGGPTNPERGIYVGSDLDEAVTRYLDHEFNQVHVEMFLHDEWPRWMGNEDKEKAELFWPRIDLTIDRAIDLMQVPDEEQQTWRSYFFAKTGLNRNMKPHRRSGYHGGLDQLASWDGPLGDDEYETRIQGVDNWFAIAEKFGLDPRGVDLVRHGFVSGMVDQLEQEIVYNHKNKREGRITVSANMLHDMQRVSPDLADKALHQSVLLTSSLIRAMDPWGHRFKKQ